MTPRSLIAPARLAGAPILRAQSDARLVDLTRAGCAPAFEAIVARYQRPLTRYCSRLLSDEGAEDAVQQTFLKAYDAMLGGRSELLLRPWLYRIAHNTALNLLRDRAVRHESLSEAMNGVEQPDQVLERRHGLREVVAAVRELPPRQRDALVLRELEGRSYEEIAAELGVSDGAVRQLLNRARNTLREGVSAVTPVAALLRIPYGEQAGVAARVAELGGGAGASAVATKLCATAFLTGAVVGGVVAAPHHPGHRGATVSRATSLRAAATRTPSAGVVERARGGARVSASAERRIPVGDDGPAGGPGPDPDPLRDREGSGDRHSGGGEGSGPGPSSGRGTSDGPGPSGRSHEGPSGSSGPGESGASSGTSGPSGTAATSSGDSGSGQSTSSGEGSAPMVLESIERSGSNSGPR